jgi:myo-inositol-1(or 4)-monophosphatase
MLPSDFLDQVEAVARAGAAPLLRLWRRLDPGQVSEKARNDLVSDADRAAEAVILAEVAHRFPDHQVLSEEAGWSRRSGNSPVWIVDPLDGTTNYVQGFPHFAVSIGVAVDGRVEAGVVLDPIKGDVPRARGRAWWNSSPCRVSGSAASRRPADDRPVPGPRLLDPYLAIFRDAFQRCGGIRRPGSAALDFAYTACGIFDGFFEFELQPWDVAAGSLLVEEAGGLVTDMDGGADFLASGGVLCGPEGVHGELLEIVQRHRSWWAERALNRGDIEAATIRARGEAMIENDAGGSSQKKTAYQEIEKAVVLTRQRRYAEALAIFEKHLQLLSSHDVADKRVLTNSSSSTVCAWRWCAGLRRGGPVLQPVAEEPVHGSRPSGQPGARLPRAQRPRQRHRESPRRPAPPAQQPPDPRDPQRHRHPPAAGDRLPVAEQPSQRLARPPPSAQALARQSLFFPLFFNVLHRQSWPVLGPLPAPARPSMLRVVTVFTCSAAMQGESPQLGAGAA